jgi:hypothetical protein
MLPQNMASSKVAQLTPFEQEVIRLLSENNSLLKQNYQLLVRIEDNVRRIKSNTS